MKIEERRNSRSWFAAVGAVVLLAMNVQAQDPEWSVVKPSNTGIPGEEIRMVTHAPNGDVWVAARWPFWGEGGVGILDRVSEVWTTHANWTVPIPSPFVNDIEYTSDGTAWISTGAGLVKFDGTNWTVFDATNTPMSHSVLRDISIGPDDKIWINNSSNDIGGDAIWEFDGVSTWRRFAVPDELPWEAPWTDLSHVYVASNGHVWVANDTLSGVAEFDGSTWTLRGTSLGKLDEIAEDGFGNIWINGNGVGGDYAYFRWNGSSFTRYPIASPTTLAADPDSGAVYFGNWHGTVHRTLDGGQTIETFLTGLNRVTSIAPNPAGTDVWIGTAGAVGHFEDNGTWVRDYNSYNTGMPWYWVESMMTDRSGYFWFATGEAGLTRFDGTEWRNWGEHNAGSEPYPFAGNEPMGAAYEDSTGTHWFGGNGIARWDSEADQFTGFWNWENNPGMGASLFTGFAEDAAGNVFAVSDWGTTFRFDPAQQLWVRENVQPYAPVGLPGMSADSQGTVWIAAWFDIHRWDGTSWAKVTLPDPDYFFDMGGIASFAIGPDDTLWFGVGDGLVSYDGATFTKYDTANSPIPFGITTGLDVREDGLIGLGVAESSANSAIVTIDGDPSDDASWTVYPYGETPQPHWQIRSAAFDANGDFWVSCLSEGCVVLHVGEIVPPDCKTGSVNAAVGPVTDTLFVNGSSGGPERTIVVGGGGAITASMEAPPAGGRRKYVVHMNLNVPTPATERVLPANVGLICYPLLLPESSPVAIWNNIGKGERIGYSQYWGPTIPDPARAPADFLVLPNGDANNLPVGSTVTLQGVILDPGSVSPKAASVTNAVILSVE